ncbi:transposase [Microvirga sp. M2]|uniref:transposase n=1 Tax=Microvirga sp. M2 TaxID=3073270 RepID=UPI0039C2758F
MILPLAVHLGLACAERRRRWSREDQLRILSEWGAEGASASEVARRHDVTLQPLYQWRRELRRSRLTATEHPTLVPVQVSNDPATAIPVVGRLGDRSF